MIWAPSLVADKNPSRTSLDGKSRRPSINSAPSGSRWFRRNHFSLRSITVILTSVTFVTIYICTYGEAPHWSTNARRLGDLAAAHVQGAFGYSFAEPPKTVEERVGDRKFLVRDWSPWLGWNNVRYIIETGLLLANLLDRELVLPGFTYATACEFDVEVCAKLAPYFIQNVSIPISSIPDGERSKYPDPDEGKDFLLPPVPTQHHKAWVLPLEAMLDVSHLTASWNKSLTLKDFLELTSPNPSDLSSSPLGLASGKWSTRNNNNQSYRKIPNSFFTTRNRTRIDRMPRPVVPLLPEDRAENMSAISVPPQVLDSCRKTLDKLGAMHGRRREKRDLSPDFSDNSRRFPSWNDVLIGTDELYGELGDRDHDLLEQCLASKEYRTAYGYGMLAFWMKTAFKPTKYYRTTSRMLGLWDELHSYNETILHIEGEIHDGFQPGAMLWSTLEGRKNYETLVRSAVRPPDLYDRIATRLEERMRQRCEGRSWRAGHLRRGDFLQVGWGVKDISEPYHLIERNLEGSVATLKGEPDLLKALHVAYNTSLKPPEEKDPIYLATNARSAEEIKFLRSKNVVLLNDLLDDADRAELGFRAPFTDTLSILEQCLMMRSAAFFGDAHSSVAGWILNRRAFHGIDSRLSEVEFLTHQWDGERP